MSKKIIIGITGRAGSGKSLACEWICAHIHGVEHIDCDIIGHRILEMPAIKTALMTTFGDQIIQNSTINRSALGDLVFNNTDYLNQLNAIVHPEICCHVKRIIDQTNRSIVIIEGALIHQVGLDPLCDHTLCIDSPTDDILKRRPKNTPILNHQPSSHDYINMCSHTIKNNTSTALFYQKIEQLFSNIILSN
ncbi:MAG: dephospho-CoA kinase [Candidatus Marinamargulisbacteria bacterium]